MHSMRFKTIIPWTGIICQMSSEENRGFSGPIQSTNLHGSPSCFEIILKMMWTLSTQLRVWYLITPKSKQGWSLLHYVPKLMVVHLQHNHKYTANTQPTASHRQQYYTNTLPPTWTPTPPSHCHQHQHNHTATTTNTPQSYYHHTSYTATVQKHHHHCTTTVTKTLHHHNNTTTRTPLPQKQNYHHNTNVTTTTATLPQCHCKKKTTIRNKLPPHLGIM